MGKIVVAVSLFSSLLMSTAFAAETQADAAAVDAATYQPKTAIRYDAASGWIADCCATT